MTQECKPEELSEKYMSQKNISQDVVRKNDSKIEQARDVGKQLSNMAGQEIVENLSLLESQPYQLRNGFIEYVSNIIDLNLSNCQLADLPNSLNMLKNLAYLTVNNNKLRSLPNAICELNNLKKLWVCNNLMNHVPSTLGNLSNLEVLSLNVNLLTDLPNSCAKLNRLEVCSLEDNRFKRIPNCIARGMKSLQILEFSRNPCSDLNVYPKSLELTMFCAQENDTCPSFPKWILSSKYRKLETVLMNETRFKKFDLPKRSSISYVKRLSMKRCNLQKKIVESIIAGMTSLENLTIGNDRTGTNDENHFSDMPIHMKKRPSSLEEIDICDTGLPMVPKIINKFTNLSDMNISSNNIYFLPEEICSLKNLRSLLVDKNRLTKLPENIGELVSLKWLKVRCNRLNRLPESMKSLKNLEYMDLYDNEFETIPEVTSSLPWLIGLDLEQNYFSTECLRYLRVPNYEVMRESLRNVWPDIMFGYESLCGCKSKPYTDDERIVSLSSNSSSSCLSEEEQYVCSLPPTTYNEMLHEHWDTSDDSADEFDPHEYKEPKKRFYPPFTFYKPFQRVYCPAESHQGRVITRIAQMLKNGSLVWTSSYEEGQFEDP